MITPAAFAALIAQANPARFFMGLLPPEGAHPVMPSPGEVH